MTGATCPLAADTGEDLDDDDEEDDDDDVKEHIEDTWQSRDIRGPALQGSHEGGELLVYNIFICTHNISKLNYNIHHILNPEYFFFCSIKCKLHID